MTLLDNLLENAIYVDFGEEIIYDSDQAYVDYPVRFATVQITLMQTVALTAIVDRMRHEAGFPPLYPLPGVSDSACDPNAWYNFYIGLNDFTSSHVDSCITCVVVNSDAGDNENTYTIDLTEEEQLAVLRRLNEQFQRYLHKSSGDLLAEARKELEEEACV